MMIVGFGTGMTVMLVETVLMLPELSVNVAEITKLPALKNTWETTLLPVNAPSDCGRLPSPQLTVTSLIALPLLAAAVTANVNDAGSPALGGVVGGVITSVAAAASATFTLPDAVPELATGVGVGVPVAGGVVPPPVAPCAPTLAVTVADANVVRIVRATPLMSDVTAPVLNVPLVVENVTSADGRALPLISSTVAETVEEPPVAGTRTGFAVTATRPTAAVPTRILTAFADDTLAPPESALMTAVPDAFPALNVTMARPLVSVLTSDG